MSFRPATFPCKDHTAHAKHEHTEGPDNYFYLCLGVTPQTDEGAPASGPAPQAAAVSPAAPSSPPRRFRLVRHFDVSGVSGIGTVAEGVQFDDGAVALRWKGDHPSTVAWDSIAAILAVHGHHGATDLEWVDALPADEVEGVTF